jgi:hypothetical protein
MFVLESCTLLVVFFVFFFFWGVGDGYGYMCIYAGILEPGMQYFQGILVFDRLILLLWKLMFKFLPFYFTVLNFGVKERSITYWL